MDDKITWVSDKIQYTYNGKYRVWYITDKHENKKFLAKEFKTYKEANDFIINTIKEIGYNWDNGMW